MAYGDSYSAVQSADLAERNSQLDRGQRSLQMLLGVLQNRKANEMAQKQFATQTAFSLMQMEKAQEELDWRKNLATKELEAKGSMLDFERTKQSFIEKKFGEELQARNRGFALDEQELGIRRSNEESRNKRLGDESRAKIQGWQMEDEAELRAQEAEFQAASDYAQALNERDRLDSDIKSENEKHRWNRSNELPKWIKKLQDLDSKLIRIDGNKRLKDTVVYSPEKGYVPLVPKPKARVAPMEGNVDSEGAASMEGIVSQYSRPQQTDPRIPLVKKYISQGMSLLQASEMADREATDMMQGQAVMEQSPFENMVQ